MGNLTKHLFWKITYSNVFTQRYQKIAGAVEAAEFDLHLSQWLSWATGTLGEVVIATSIEGVRDSFGQHIGQHSSLATRHGIEIY